MTTSNQIGTGRPRPVYQPLALTCPACGAGLTLQSEHSQQIVCSYCNEQVDCSSTVARALGRAPARNVRYDMKINQKIPYQGYEYVVIARMAYVDSFKEVGPRDYLLFHPQMGTFWMTNYPEYGYYLTFRSRMIPPDIFGDKSPKVEMPDGTTWKRQEQEVYTLTHVDGALPWLATVGDRLESVELQSKSDRKVTMAIERTFGPHSSGEIECSISHQISYPEWMEMLGQAAQIPKRLSLVSRVLGLMACLIGGAYSCGNMVDNISVDDPLALSTSVTGIQLSNEVVTPTFEINNVEDAVSIRFSSNLDNEWLSLNYAILQSPSADESTRAYSELLTMETELSVDSQTVMMDVGEANLSYYSGYEGGENWSEGSQSDTQLWMFPSEGTYRLLIQGVSGSGDGDFVHQSVQRDLKVQVQSGRRVYGYYGLVFAISCLLSLPFLKRNSW